VSEAIRRHSLLEVGQRLHGLLFGHIQASNHQEGQLWQVVVVSGEHLFEVLQNLLGGLGDCVVPLRTAAT